MFEDFRRFLNTPPSHNPTDNPVNATQHMAHTVAKKIRAIPAVKLMGFADGGPVPGFSDNGRIAPRVPASTARAAARHTLRTGARPGIAMPATRHRHETSPGVPCPSCAAGVTIPVW